MTRSPVSLTAQDGVSLPDLMQNWLLIRGRDDLRQITAAYPVHRNCGRQMTPHVLFPGTAADR